MYQEAEIKMKRTSREEEEREGGGGCLEAKIIQQSVRTTRGDT